MSYQISTIIPVYNVQDYIKECLDSIVQQSIGIENIEVIVVDDCSPDHSMDIVREYAQKYPSIKIVEHEYNQGLGPARNTGLKHVTTNYISFIDSDDFISKNTYEICLEKFEKFKCDFVIYEYDYYSESGKKYPRNPSGKLFNRNQLIQDINKTPEIIFSTSTCNRIYSKKFIPLLNFPDTKFEDMVVSTKASFYANKIYVTNECKYYYRKRESVNQSITDIALENKENYLKYININLEIYHLLEEYPSHKPLIDWFNARGSVAFLHRMIKRSDFSHKDRKEIYFTAKTYLRDVHEETLNRLSPSARELIIDAQNKPYWIYYIKYRLSYPHIRNKLYVTGKRIVKFLDISFWTVISFFYRLNPSKKNIWLICERGNEAKDNGYRFFQYMRQYHPEINAYYLIDKKQAKDYYRVKEMGNVIQYMGGKHKLYFILAEKLVGTHKGFLEPWNYLNFMKYFQMFSPAKKYIFLQHGIINNDNSDMLGKMNHTTPFDLFICGARAEFDFIDQYFGYLPGEVVYTGPARFDHLHDYQTKKQILLMPTWRQGIVQPSWITEKVVEDDEFLNSEYYNVFQSLINKEALGELLEKNDFELIFYPHYEVQQYLKYFKSIHKRIIVADKDHYDVQKLLKESKLLITDYSSVHMDFAYMSKPLIYYQFDKDSFFQEHYKKGYFDSERDGFGPVVETEDEVVDFIQKEFDNDFVVEEKYEKRANQFFVLRDSHNCERIYQAILNLDKHYKISDSLIKEILDKYEGKMEGAGLKIYLYNNYLMYVADSPHMAKNKIFINIGIKTGSKPSLEYQNLEFIFGDLMIKKDSRSSYIDQTIAIAKIPPLNAKKIKTGLYKNDKKDLVGEFILKD